MRSLGIVLALVIGTTASAHGTFTTNGDNCTASNFQWDGEPAHVERQVIEAGALRSFKTSVEHAPLSIVGGNGGGYTIEACKAAERREDLAAIQVTLQGGELRATGPEGRRWFVFYKVRVPDGANIDVETKNGPLSIRDVNGTVEARAANGPLSLSNVSGNVQANTTNGPISLKGGSGTMVVRATNGPLSVNLDGNSWRGGTLDASTQNGPLSLRMPRNYGSGVVVESNGRGPVSCRAEGCERYRAAERDDDHPRHWSDEPRRFELGSGAEAVRLSTVNGPITIKDE
ncbi:MAG TPA: hypothetical protein VF846_12135 [Thermoanaerobaculia bacterium]|jgi:hypothetical protein